MRDACRSSPRFALLTGRGARKRPYYSTTGHVTDFNRAIAELAKGGSLTLSSLPDGFDAFCVADLAQALAPEAEKRGVVLVHVARDWRRAYAFNEALNFAAPQIEILDFPAWDCQPYDRVSPNAAISARRMTVLSRLARSRGAREQPRLLSTTVNAILQRVPPLAKVAADSFSAAPGNVVDMDELVRWLESNGFMRSSTVRDTGEYALRGGILDLYAPAMEQPIRLDFFGDTLESIRSFDPESQRTIGQLRGLDLVPMSEVQLTSDAIRRFRQAYVATFGAQTRGDTLYESVSEGRRHPGLEHWLPLFYEDLDTLFDYTGAAPLILDCLAEDAANERLAQIKDYYEARKSAHDADPNRSSYKPLAPDALYFSPEYWAQNLAGRCTARVTPFAAPPGSRGLAVDCAGKVGRNFAPERQDEGANVFAAAAEHVRALQGEGKRVIVAGWSEGSRERLSHVLKDFGLAELAPVSSLVQATALGKNVVALAVIGLEQGFETRDLAVIGEQDILGDRLVPSRKKTRRAHDFLSEVSALSVGDLVVHVDHGIGRFFGLKAIEAAGAPHDCLEIHYADSDKLFLPVENLELLSRYGSEDTEVQLDKLGGAGWQKRKARMRKRILEMAGALLKIAAARQTQPAPKLVPPEGLYEAFCAGFPYEETEDQQQCDRGRSRRSRRRPADGPARLRRCRLRQDGSGAARRLRRRDQRQAGRRRRARRLCSRASMRKISPPASPACRSRSRKCRAWSPQPSRRTSRPASPRATIDIVVGTHAVLGKTVAFKDLGLVIIDEEQHFGVKHKERLKELRAEVHVLTLSATPIPRTLQLALTGVRELSIIATPPVDRLAVRTFISPFDELLVREALLRERYRGGQSFYVCPRIEDIEDAAALLAAKRARSEIRRRAWAVAGDRARRAHGGLLRRQI